MRENEKMKHKLQKIYSEARNSEMQVNRGGMNNKEALKIMFDLIGQLTTIMNEMVD